MSGNIQFPQRVYVHRVESCPEFVFFGVDDSDLMMAVPRDEAGRYLQDVLDRGLSADSPYRRIGEPDTHSTAQPTPSPYSHDSTSAPS